MEESERNLIKLGLHDGLNRRDNSDFNANIMERRLGQLELQSRHLCNTMLMVTGIIGYRIVRYYYAYLVTAV